MKKGIANNSPAMEMLTAMEERAEKQQEQVEVKPQVKKQDTQAPKAPKETKSKHLQLLIKPSTFIKLKTASDRQGQSVNEYINNLLEEVLGE